MGCYILGFSIRTRLGEFSSLPRFSHSFWLGGDGDGDGASGTFG